jgi:hypothetical protein
MRYTVGVGSGAMIYIPSYIKLLRGKLIQTQK